MSDLATLEAQLNKLILEGRALEAFELLYAEDIEYHFARMQAYAEPEIFGDEWTAEPLPSAAGSSAPSPS